MAFKLWLLPLFSLLASNPSPLPRSEPIPDMFFEVALTTEGSEGWYHYLQFSSYRGECELIEITISDILFYVERLSSVEGKLTLARGYGKDEFVIKYVNPNNSTKMFVFTYDKDNYLTSINGSATSIAKMPSDRQSKVSIDKYVEMKSAWAHWIPVTLKTVLPGVYPRGGGGMFK